MASISTQDHPKTSEHKTASPEHAELTHLLLTLQNNPHDNQASTHFVRLTTPFIRTIVRRQLGDSQGIVEDVTQEIYMKIFRISLRSFDPDRSRKPESWIGSIAHNFCKDVYKSSRYQNPRKTVSLPKEQTNDDNVETEKVDPKSVSPMTRSCYREALDAVTRSFEQLPEASQRALTLSLEGKTHEEIGRIMGKPPAAIRSTLRRARRKMIALDNYRTY